MIGILKTFFGKTPILVKYAGYRTGTLILKCMVCMVVSVCLRYAPVSAQVVLSGSTAQDNTYATLAAAFTALNGAAQTSRVITITITGNTFEPTATGAVLNAGAWTSITISPSGGSWTVSAAMNAGIPLIDFNGADRVTINGNNNLTFVNTTASEVANTCTIRFYNTAQFNAINNCTLLGSSRMVTPVAGGTLFYGSGNNNNNTVSGCNIGDASGGLHYMAINSTTGTTTAANTVTVSGCNIYNYFSDTSASQGINLGTGNFGWNIIGNRFYQTATRTYNSSNARFHSAILINDVNNYSFVVKNNIIGFASSSGTGTYTIDNNNNSFFPRFSCIDMNVSSAAASTVQGNIISSINLTTAFTTAQLLTNGVFAGIMVRSGNVNVGGDSAHLGNRIGDSSILNDIRVTVNLPAPGSSVSADVHGIFLNGSSLNNLNVKYNVVSSFYCSGSNSANLRLIGTNITAGGPFINIWNNTLGGRTATRGAVQNETAGYIHGIAVLNNQTSGGDVRFNTVSHCYGNSNNQNLTTTASLIGINISATTNGGDHLVIRNTVHSLSNTYNATNAVGVFGVLFSLGANSFARLYYNQIHSLSIASSSNTSVMAGVQMRASGTVYLINNFIRLGIDGNGNSVTTPCAIAGVYDLTTLPSRLYYNSIYIGGSGVNNTSGQTYALYTNKTASTLAICAYNIFCNVRNSGGTGNGGPHGAVRYNLLTGWTNNYNLYHVPNSSGNSTGSNTSGAIWAGVGTGAAITNNISSNFTSFSSFKTSTGEANAATADPLFNNPQGTSETLDLHIDCPPTAAIFPGANIPVAEASIDFDSDPRSTTSQSAGADELTPLTIYSRARLTCATTPIVNGLSCANLNGGNNWVYFYQTGTKKVIAAINPNGCNLGTVTVTMRHIDSSFSALQSYTDHAGFNWFYFNKIWNITSTGGAPFPANTYPLIRLYYTNAEMNLFRASAGFGCNPCTNYSDSDLVMLQALVSVPDCDATNNGSASQYNFYWNKNIANYSAELMDITLYGLNVSVPLFGNTVNFYGDIASGLGAVVNTSNTEFDGRYFQATVPSFSEFRLFLPVRRVLPVRWLAFEAKPVQQHVALSWKATETEAVRYVIEYSSTGAIFNAIGEVVSEQLPGTHPYQYVHLSPVVGNNYYRIKVLTLSGQTYYSEIKKVQFNTSNSIAGQVYPNPATHTITLSLQSQKAGMYSVSVIDLTGRNYLTQNGRMEKGQNQLSFDINRLNAGYYLLKLITAEGERLLIPFIKQSSH